MKKQLLVLVALFSYCLSFAQFGTPFDVTVCGGGEVYFGDETSVILNGQTGYTVTYHLTANDAEMGANPLPEPFLFTATQTVWVRIAEDANPSNYQIETFMVTVSLAPQVFSQSFTICDADGVNDGITFVDLGSAAEQIWQNTPTQSSFSVDFYLSMADAQTGTNALVWWEFQNTTSPQTIYYTATDDMTGCQEIAALTIHVALCNQECVLPTQFSAFGITETTFTVSWTENGTADQWELFVTPHGSPAPTVNTPGIVTTVNPYVVTGLNCGSAYQVYIRAMCSDTEISQWSPVPLTVEMPCMPDSGWPVNLEQCSDTNQACFDLTQNDANILASLDPADYTITYHTTYNDAAENVSPISNALNYCVTQPDFSSVEIFARLENNESGDFLVMAFGLTVRNVETGNFTPTPMSQCDDNGDGIVIFDLTSVAAQLNTTFPLSYYTNSLDATSVSGANALPNPQAYQMAVTFGIQTMTIFVRENIPGGCDVVYSLMLNASSNCNLANVCSNANSLCASLGVPFANTINIGTAQPGIDYNCLATQPNPTWFYLPISEAGNPTFLIQQTTWNGGGLDVDFIAWGPFSSPDVCSPASLNPTTQVDCSYSASPIEQFTIPNAQPGQFYMLMVTNFSNQPGTITISQTNMGQPGSGQIDCSGIRMTAFLDDNGNGTKDSGEPNFLLGEFHYEKNGNGTVHNVTSATGSHSIFEMNPANSYDINYTVDPAYAANYAVSPSSFSNVSINAGAGLIDYYFPVTVTQAYDDLAVYIIPNQAPQPGFNYTNTVHFVNLGSQTVASGTVTFTKPSVVSINTVSEAGATVTPSGFTYNFTNLLPFESREIIVNMSVPTIPTVTLGQALVALADIVPLAGDIAPANNSSTLTQVIIGSYDPNDKMESRGEYVLFEDFGADDYLYYTIRFENTGTAPALNVSIVDVLESQLDETTVRMVHASHDYVLDRTGNVLNWKFENIQLPYASANPEGAKGYVQFKVRPKAGFAIGDVIQNTASIFFDFNPAIVTNTFETHFVETLGNVENDFATFAMYPNPAGDYLTVSLNDNSGSISAIAVYDMLGKNILNAKPSASSSVETLDVSALSNGMYFLEVTTSEHVKTTKKLIIK